MPQYLWFHAFRRDTVQDVLDALRSGPEVSTNATRTKQNEAELGISPSCVYAYLGMPSEEFGDIAFAVPAHAIDGLSSPFDSGGLVNHIRPVSGWEQARRRGYLSANTWPTQHLGRQLAAYPGLDQNDIRNYLDGKRPAHEGPHALFPPGSDQYIAPIWRDASNVCAWLWEGRVPGRIPTGDTLLRWSCASSAYHSLISYADTVTDPNEIEWLAWLMARWVKGGVATLGQSLRSAQEVA